MRRRRRRASPPCSGRRASPSAIRRRDARGRRACSYEAFLREEVDDLLRGVAAVLDLARVAARRRITEGEHLGLRACVACLCGLDADVAERDRIERLLL